MVFKMITKRIAYTLLILTLMLNGCGVMKKAPILQYELDASVIVYHANELFEEELDPVQSQNIIQQMNQMKPTRIQSIQDIPNQEIEHQIKIQDDNIYAIFYFYQDQGKYYAECPYTGVYECDENFYQSLSQYAQIQEEVPAVMVDGHLYVSTEEIDTNLKCGVMDGEITSSVESYLLPEKNDSSNFGTGYSYQYAGFGKLCVLIDGQMVLFKDESVYTCIAEIIEKKKVKDGFQLLMYPYFEDRETAQVRNIPEITIRKDEYVDFDEGDTVEVTFRKTEHTNGHDTAEILNMVHDDFLYRTAHQVFDLIAMNPVKIEIHIHPAFQESEPIIIEDSKEISKLMNEMKSVTVYEEYIEPRGAGGLSFELIFTDSNQNTKVIVAGFGIQVENTKYGYHFVDGVKVLNEILIQALQIEE